MARISMMNWTRAAVFAATALCSAVSVPGLAGAATAGTDLQLQGQGNGPVPPVSIGGPSVLVAQNQQTAAELLVRIQQLEELVRNLTGRIEGLEFQLGQMQTQLQKMTEDNEFRFQQLEGGAPKPRAEAPAAQTAAPAAETAAPAAAQPADGQALDLTGGDSADPLLQGGTNQLGTLDGEPKPLDLNLNGGKLSTGDAAAQYQAGYEAVQRGDYPFAEQQFQQFLELYPDDPNAADAVSYVGEAMIQRQAYTDAAQVLADGYTKYKDSPRAPEIMLKLGVALAGADQVDVACRTFFTLKQRYPDLSQAFKDRLAAETDKAKCPVR
jgi:tol-pal system protein YbgF